jgi:hypothetical protein
MSLNAQVLLNNAGRIRCSTAVAPAFTSGGTPVTALGLLSLSLVDPNVANGSIGYLSATAPIAAEIGGAVATVSNGLPFTAAGRLACDQAGAITTHVAGLPFTATGALATAAPE